MNEKRIPTIVGILLVLGLIGGLTLVKRGAIFFSQASKGISPKEVRITNITDSSFVVSWETDKKTSGFVEVVNLDQEKTIPDYRDQQGNLGEYDTHYMVVENLEADKRYEFVVNSGGKKFYKQGETPYSIKTAMLVFGQPPSANLASGKVVTSEENLAQGAIVYINISGISPLSALVTSKGNWVVSLAQAYSENLNSRADYQEGRILEQINVNGGQLGRATVKVFTNNDDPVPTIKLGQDFDFTDIENGDLSELTVSPTSSPGSKLEEGIDVSEKKEFKIINPGEGETIKISRPEIFGEGPSGGEIKIILESSLTQEAEIEIDADGSWQWTPPENLSPGTHTLKVNYTDPETGQEETYVRTFVLAASVDETGPAFSATPSGDTTTPTLTLAPTSTPQMTSTPTLVPTEVVSASPTEELTPTVSPEVQPSTESGVPKTGFLGPTLVLLGGSLILFLSLAI
jgi:hypothetical protein